MGSQHSRGISHYETGQQRIHTDIFGIGEQEEEGDNSVTLEKILACCVFTRYLCLQSDTAKYFGGSTFGVQDNRKR